MWPTNLLLLATYEHRRKWLSLHTVTRGSVDGLELQGRTLYAVRNTNVVTVIRLDSQFAAGTVLGDISNPRLDVPTTATAAAGRLWVVNARFGTGRRQTRSTGSLNCHCAQETPEIEGKQPSSLGCSVPALNPLATVRSHFCGSEADELALLDERSSGFVSRRGRPGVRSWVSPRPRQSFDTWINPPAVRSGGSHDQVHAI